MYPHLDPSTLWLEAPGGGVLVGAVSNPPSVAAPRVYAHHGPQATVLYDGLPLDVSGRVQGHDAAALATAWHDLPEILEGRYVAVRVERAGPSIDVLTDPTGLAQVYVHEAGGASIVSNNADLIARTFGLTEPDPVGASTFLTLDWVAGDRTLWEGVRVVPGAQRWRWTIGDRAWDRRTYWQMAAHAGRPDLDPDDAFMDGVIDDMARFAATAAAVNGTANAPLSGGKDSRMLASLFMTRGVPVRYWTKGDEASLDVQIATEIARRYHLPHHVANRPTEPARLNAEPTTAIATRWAELSATFVAQNDGIASLMNIGNIHGEPVRVDRIDVTFTGICGETARASMEYPPLFAATRPATVAGFVVARRVDHRRGLVTREAFMDARDHVEGAIRTLHRQGSAVPNLPKAWYIEDKCRRWAPMNARELSQTEDKVVPCMTRPWIEAILRLRPEARWRNLLHRRLIARLVPGLDMDPPTALPWPGALPGRPGRERLMDRVRPLLPYDVRLGVAHLRDRLRPPVVYRSPTVPYDESAWIEANLPSIREVIMSRGSSPLWAYVDRRHVDRLLRSSTPADERRLHENALFATLTMFEHERLDQALRLSGPPPAFMAAIERVS